MLGAVMQISLSDSERRCYLTWSCEIKYKINVLLINTLYSYQIESDTPAVVSKFGLDPQAHLCDQLTAFVQCVLADSAQRLIF